eukprot:s964_g16.t1
MGATLGHGILTNTPVSADSSRPPEEVEQSEQRAAMAARHGAVRGTRGSRSGSFVRSTARRSLVAAATRSPAT